MVAQNVFILLEYINNDVKEICGIFDKEEIAKKLLESYIDNKINDYIEIMKINKQNDININAIREDINKTFHIYEISNDDLIDFMKEIGII